MTTNATLKKKLRGLPIDQRVDLLEELSLSIARDQRDLPLAPWQKEIIDQRLADDDVDPSNRIPAKELHSRMETLKAQFAARQKRNEN